MIHGDPEAFLVIHATLLPGVNSSQFLLNSSQPLPGEILLRRSSDEVSVLSFACTASCTSTAQAQAFFWVEL